jgi:hypothetical protein
MVMNSDSTYFKLLNFTFKKDFKGMILNYGLGCIRNLHYLFEKLLHKKKHTLKKEVLHYYKFNSSQNSYLNLSL